MTHNLDPALQADDYHIIKQSYDLFTRYVHAITKGQVEVDVEIIELPDVCFNVSVTTTLPYVASGSISPVWDALSDKVKDETDFWLVLYPSHVPEDPVFDKEAFITGGMGLDSKGGPIFIIDDKWIVRKPAHLGSGNYSEIERRIYLPQWYQHEFFHHLFRIYPEYQLEVNGHDWFNRDFWPDDFEGQFETDFYSEALHKRLQTDCTPLSTKLITRVDNLTIGQLGKLYMDELVGVYTKDDIQNNWHEGEILKQGNQYFWRNKANVQWQVFPNLIEGRLDTGADCPYPGQNFFLELYQTIAGEYLPSVIALKFNGEPYRKRFNLLRERIPFEIALGEYTRVPYETTLHSGRLIKESGNIFWKNGAGDTWSLNTNEQEESFSLGMDSPTPSEDFKLIFSENECELHVLGFRYLGYYYWREKRNLHNESPILVNPIADLQLKENFNTHTVNLSDVFSDPEGDLIQHFATSSSSGLISTTIENQQLILIGGQIGTITIFVTAIDLNGGFATDEFNIQVGDVVSTQDQAGLDQYISIFPNPTQGNIAIVAELPLMEIMIYSAQSVLLQELSATTQEVKLDLSHYTSGVYFINIKNKNSGQTTFKRLVKIP